MGSLRKEALACALAVCGSMAWSAAPQAPGTPAVTIRRVAVLGNSNYVEVEITASQPVTPQTQVVTGPERLVIDFPNAVPGSDLRNVPVNRAEVKDVRVGLFTADPPVTRVVLDLKTPQTYQVFPSGNTVIVKVGAGEKVVAAAPSPPAIVSHVPVHAARLVKPAPLPEVESQGGNISSITAPGITTPGAANKPAVTIQRVAVLGSGNDVELEIAASQAVIPHTEAANGPDRLIIDFPNAVPSSDLRNISVNRGEVRGVRVGLFAKDPPITRVVLDLKTPQPYQLFPSGKTIIVKLSAAAKRNIPVQGPAALAFHHAPAPQPPLAKPAAKVQVNYAKGQLSIWADKASLAEVLYEVHRRTGADIPIPAGAEQDQVVTSLGPGPAREVVASLLNGSRFNFIMVGSEGDPAQLRSVLLTVKDGLPAGIIYSSESPAPVAQAEPEPVQPEPVQSENPPDPQPQAEAPPPPPPPQ
jgi:hypothetical protein